MKNLFLALSLFASSLYGLSLDEVITKALEKNPSLESITHRIHANRSDIKLANLFSNPIISYTQNTIDEAQAMSQKTLLFQQKLPYFGKRDSLKKVALAQESVLNENLQQAKVSLVEKIKNQAFTVWELKNIYKIIDDYEELTKQNIELFESYTTTSNNQHMGIMSAELTLSDLRIQKSDLDAKIYTAYAKLSYLASFKVEKLELKLSISDMPSKDSLQENLVNNHSLAIKNKEIQKSRALVKTAELNHYPDINLLAGYSYRNNFDNFATFGIGVSLPIYGSEDYKEQKARKLTLVAQSKKEDIKIKLDSEFKTAYLEMKSAYNIYNIVHKQALPQIEHMFDLTSSSISTGGDLFKYIDILVQKLKLEQKSIRAIANYNRSLAKISALSGEMK
ncbi:MAG: TolC family protein [Sulfurimonas sp.]|nr:TolC family protein [Sulfurimonas sp.]